MTLKVKRLERHLGSKYTNGPGQDVSQEREKCNPE